MHTPLLVRSLASLSLVAAAGLDAAAQQKRVYIAPDDHTDYFWTADEDAYRQAFLDMIDFYLDQADATQGNPPDYQSRWHCDGSHWMWEYERHNPADFPRLISRIRSGHVSVALNPLVANNGGSHAEAVLRGMYYPGRIERRENLRFRLAIFMENQTFPCGLPSLWAGSGATYSWKGVCGCVTAVPGLSSRDHEIYRATGPDGSGVLMRWHSLFGSNESIGGYAEARFPFEAVDFITVNAPFNGFLARYPFNVVGAFGKGWDDFQTFTTEFVTTAQAATNPSRRVIVSNITDFFDDFVSTHGPGGQATLTQSFGNEWDADAAAFAEVSARMKRATELLRPAESLALLASLHDPAFMDPREQDRDRAFQNMGLFYEHNMGMQSPPTGAAGIAARAAWQRRLADEAHDYVTGLLADAAGRLGALIPAAAPHQRFFAFNPLSWERADFADLPWTSTQPVHVVDLSTGLEIPFQIVDPTPLPGETARRLRVWATGVPAMGYKVFEIRPGPGAATFPPLVTVVAGSPPAPSLTIQSPRYRLTLQGRGAITSLIDRAQNDREFAATVAGRAINDLGPASGSVTVESAGPVSLTLLATAPSPLAHTTRVTLFREGERIAIHNQITQNFDATSEWGYSFALASPRLVHEELGAVLDARLTTQGGHYAPRNARYDLLTFNHFADLAEPGPSAPGITLSNWDCMFLRRGNSGTISLDVSTPRLSVLAGGRVNGSAVGMVNQIGDSLFTQRFAARSHAAQDQAGAMRFALEHQNPLVTGLVTGSSPDLPATSFSLLTSSNPDVIVWALKPSDDGFAASDSLGGAVTLRAWNISNAPAQATFQIAPRGVASAAVASHIETLDPTLGPAPALTLSGMTAAFGPQQMRTFRIRLACPGDADGSGSVTFADVTAVLASFGSTYLPATGPGDADRNGVVNFADITAALAGFNTACP
ncbi:MAG: glycoside hydrolase [Planctomycetota bacterium]|nr:glycoside hydrolase [Planctomycetota bacterium]